VSDYGEQKQRAGDLFKEEVTFPCPFCGAQCAATDPPAIVHVMPPCKQFIELDPIAFLKAANWVERRKN